MKKEIELFFALVGPVGTELGYVSQLLRESLEEVKFQTEEIVLSKLLHHIGDNKEELSYKDEYERIRDLMNAGNDFREQLQMGEALALLAIRMVFRQRLKVTNND